MVPIVSVPPRSCAAYCGFVNEAKLKSPCMIIDCVLFTAAAVPGPVTPIVPPPANNTTSPATGGLLAGVGAAVISVQFAASLHNPLPASVQE